MSLDNSRNVESDAHDRVAEAVPNSSDHRPSSGGLLVLFYFIPKV